MSIDLEQFHQIFFEESFEGLEVMESGLLNHDPGSADIEEINTIFRAAHSIKGGSGTFGFTEISSFTHVMETLLDEMRNGRRGVTRNCVDLLLESVDCLSEMLSATKAGKTIDLEHSQQIHQRFEQLLNNIQITKPELREWSADTKGLKISIWHIRFIPHSHLFLTGNDPFRLLRELNTLGELERTLDVSRLPIFSELNPEDCHLAWELTLKSEVSYDEVMAIFEWVEDDCDIEITSLNIGNKKNLDSLDLINREDACISKERSRENNDISVQSLSSQHSLSDQRKGDQNKQETSKATRSMRVSIDKVDALINMVGELVITQSMLSQLSENLNTENLKSMRGGLEQLDRNTRELQENIMQIRMLPISFSFNRFPRLVHDLSGKLEKKVELKISGEQTELDKNVLEKISDPLVHLIRNSLDHDIESPAVRKAAGKPETGTIHLNAYHQGGNVLIEISDDGAGLNKEKIVNKAKERGLVNPDETLLEERVYDLLFLPGFSTAEKVSDVSGRGVGMDVVKRNIKDLGGMVGVSSHQGKGSIFTIRLPLTLAILDGQLVRIGKETYIIPLVSIIESLQIKSKYVNSVTGKTELYKLRDDYIPIIRLYQVFNIEPDSTDLNDGLLVVVDIDGRHAGIYVDELLSQQQVVIKSLETNYQSVKGISGATILGNGTVALILDIPGISELSNNTSIEESGTKGIHDKAVA